MNTILFVLGIVSLFLPFGSTNSISRDAETKNVLDDFIMSIINNFKDVIVNGNECLGIPPMDPLSMDGFPLNISTSLLKMQGVIADVESTGLKSLEATHLSCNLLTLAIELVMDMPSFHVGGLYDVNGLAALILPIYGKGPFSMNIDDMKIEGRGALGARLNGSLYMKELNFTIQIGNLDINFDGLLGGGELGETLNQIINIMGLSVYNTIHDMLHDTLMSVMLDVVNFSLKDVRLADIIGGIIKPPGPIEDCDVPASLAWRNRV